MISQLPRCGSHDDLRSGLKRQYVARVANFDPRDVLGSAIECAASPLCKPQPRTPHAACRMRPGTNAQLTSNRTVSGTGLSGHRQRLSLGTAPLLIFLNGSDTVFVHLPDQSFGCLRLTLVSPFQKCFPFVCSDVTIYEEGCASVFGSNSESQVAYRKIT